jgi:hypothetical protein
MAIAHADNEGRRFRVLGLLECENWRLAFIERHPRRAFNENTKAVGVL